MSHVTIIVSDGEGELAWVRKSTPSACGLGIDAHVGFASGSRASNIENACTKICACARSSTACRVLLAVSRMEIERRANQVRVVINTAKPGIIIGKRGAGIEELRKKFERESRQTGQRQRRRDQASRAGRETRRQQYRRSAREAHRVPPRHAPGDPTNHEGRRARHQSASAADASAAPRSRASSATSKARFRCTRCAPTSTTRTVEAYTTYGRIGVKVWIYLGEVLPDGQGRSRKEPRPWRRGVPACLVNARHAQTRSHKSLLLKPRARPLRPACNPHQQTALAVEPEAELATEEPAGPLVAEPTPPPTQESKVIDVVAQASQASQSAARTDEGPCAVGQRFALRRVRIASARAGVDHQPSDRSRAYRDDASHQARRQGLDHDFPGQVVSRRNLRRRARVPAKAQPEGWVAVVRPGRVLFELSGVDELVAKQALRLAAFKLPIRTKVLRARRGG